ncbi:hypothetical protein ACK3YH_12360 [Aeromonas caviae]
MNIFVSFLFLASNMWLYYFFSKKEGSLFNIFLLFFVYIFSYGYYLYSVTFDHSFSLYVASLSSVLAMWCSFLLHRRTSLNEKNPLIKSAISNNRIVFWCAVFLLLSMSVIFFILVKGAPLLSDDPNLERLTFISSHSFIARLINYIIPFCFYISMLFYNSVEEKRSHIVNYAFMLIALSPALLLGNKSSVVTFILITLLFQSSIVRKEIYHRKALLILGLLSVILLFSIHMSDKNIVEILISVKMRLIDYSGVKVVYDDFVPREGFLYGMSILYEINSIFSALGLTESELTQTTGNYISRWYHGFDNDYMFEYVFPIHVIGYLNGGLILSFFFSFISSYFFFYFYKLSKATKISVTKVFYFIVSYTFIQVFISGKPGSYMIANILSYVIFLFIILSARSFFLAVIKR